MPFARPRKCRADVEITDVTTEARANPAFDGHERIVRAVDMAAGLHAIIAIHDRTLGPAIGGCRMWPYESEARRSPTR